MWKGINILIVSASIDVPELCRVGFKISRVNYVSIVFVRL
jgi:hypothetical protein